MSESTKKEEFAEEKNSSRKWLIGLGIVALILVWLAPPLAAELFLSRNIGKLMDADVPEDVDLDTNTFKLLSGKFDKLFIKGNNLSIGNLDIERYELLASSGQIAILKTLTKKDVFVKESPVATLTLHVSIKDMENMLSLYYESLNEINVSAYEGYLEIIGISDTPQGKEVPIVFQVVLSSSDWASLEVKVVELKPTVQYIEKLSDEENEELVDIYSICIPFDKTSPAIFINSVEIFNEEIIITANTSLS